MASAVATLIDLKNRNSDVLIAGTDAAAMASTDTGYVSGDYAVEVTPNKNDTRTMFLITNSDDTNAITVNILAGDSPIFGSGANLAISVAAGTTKAIAVDSARYEQMSSGKYVFYSTASTFNVTPILLP